MAKNTEFSNLRYALNLFFIRQGIISYPKLNTDGLIRCAQRVSGKPFLSDPGKYLREFAAEHGIRPANWQRKASRKRQPRVRYSGTDPFYLSPEWQALRYRLIRDSDGKCQACGATAKSSGRPMHVDHIEPRSKRPDLALEYSNLQLLCEACNLGKRNTDSIRWKDKQ